jgi:hypothetical protein
MHTKHLAADIANCEIQREQCDLGNPHASEKRRLPSATSGGRQAASYRLPDLSDVFKNVPAWANDGLC